MDALTEQWEIIRRGIAQEIGPDIEEVQDQAFAALAALRSRMTALENSLEAMVRDAGTKSSDAIDQARRLLDWIGVDWA